MDDLARELGISKKTIYQYYSDKNALVETILLKKLEEDQKACQQFIQESTNAIQAFMNVISMVVETMGQIHPSVFYDLQKYHPNAFKIMKDHQVNFVTGMIQKNVYRGIEEGVYRSELDPGVISRIYVHVVDGIIRREIETVNNKTFSEFFTEAIQFMIHGMVTEKGRNFLKSQINNQ